MRKWFLFGFIAFVIVAGGILFFGGVEEPTSEGRTLSQWLSLYEHASAAGDQEEQERSKQNVRAIGTNAIPFLIDWLATSDWRITAGDVGSDLVWKMSNGAIVDDTSRARQERAVYGFEILGTHAVSAIPELMRLLRGHQLRAKIGAAESLSHIGSPALPGFLEWYMKTGAPEADRTRSALARMGTNLIPGLVFHLTGPIELNRMRATWLLVEIREDPTVVGDEVVRCLEHATLEDRNKAILSLAKYESGARGFMEFRGRGDRDSDFQSLTVYVSNRVMQGTSR